MPEDKVCQLERIVFIYERLAYAFKNSQPSETQLVGPAFLSSIILFKPKRKRDVSIEKKLGVVGIRPLIMI